MNKTKLVLMTLTVPLLFACGSRNSNNPPPAAKSPSVPAASVVAPQTDHGKMAKSKAIHQAQAEISNNSKSDTAPMTAEEAKPENTMAAAAPAPAAPVEAAPVEAKPEPKKVIALGSAGQPANEFLNRGYGSAINSALSCRVTGSFNGVSPCFMVFSDGTTAPVNAANRELIDPYISELQTQSQELKSKEQAEKLAKREAKLKLQLDHVQKEIQGQQADKKIPVQN
jgi:hypothetical protein